MALEILGSGQSNYTARQAIFVHSLRLGENTPNSTPPIDSGDSDTYRFALRMPTIGKITRVVVNYKSVTLSPQKLDFRIYGSPYDVSLREANDLIYEKVGIDVGTVWDHDFGDKPLAFANRVAHQTETSTPRNFLWIETVPTGGVDSVVLVDLYFEV